ncbi:complex I subunit 5 family protein [Natronomonas marina]|jgi:multicomponent Na+:H+ antiporter subunit D|uniref:complex I subunit 5 family protein n=1 Tax=Natronomonas marina TaxID=2961939 RepID=UPI0020CA2662|nr:proton-conducting transporter membrane subunit [Natronomonas marina]
MTGTLVVAPLLVVFGTAVATLAVRSRPRLQRATSVAGVAVYAAAVAALAWTVVLSPDAPGAVAYQVGGIRAPHGITLVADALSAFMLSLAAVVGLYAVAVSVRFIDRRNQRTYYHPTFQLLLVGVTGAFLAGDLFNLFVWFEVTLMASYVFVAFYGGAEHTAAAMRYLVLNVLGSVCMLVAVGGLYATVGTLNMAEMAQRLVASPASVRAAPLVGFGALLFVTFALKAGLAPFQFWVPAAYRAAPMPVAAVLAGVTKKVGIYAIVRLYFTVFAGAAVSVRVPGLPGTSPLAALAPVLGVAAAASVLVGGIGAVNRDSVDGLLAYSSIGQVGFIAVPIAVAAADPSLRRLGLLAALIYALHHALTKGLLFFVAAVVRDVAGTTRLAEVGGLGQRSPILGAVFFVGGLSLVGIPPLAGFFGKLLVFEVAAARLTAAPTPAAVLTVLVLLVGALLTIVYTTRAWMSSVWGVESERVETGSVDRPLVALVATLAVLVVAVGVGFEPVYRFADAAAGAALDTDGYVEVVLGGAGT